MKKYGFKRMISMILAAGMVAAMAGCGSSSTSSAGGAGADDAGGSDKTKIVLLLNGYLGDLAGMTVPPRVSRPFRIRILTRWKHR